MEQIGSFLSQYATKEVLTILGTGVTAWAGWKTAKFSYGVISSLAKRASFLGLASAVLLTVGLGAAGFGVGEINVRPENHGEHGISNQQLAQIAKTPMISPEVVKEILSYAKARDTGATVETVAVQVPSEGKVTVDPVKESSLKAEESVMSVPTAWSLIGIGIATSVSALAVFATRHNRRNPDDPNHPHFGLNTQKAA